MSAAENYEDNTPEDKAAWRRACELESAAKRRIIAIARALRDARDEQGQAAQ